MIESTIKRIVKRLWPELTGDLHLPQWGRIVTVHAIKAPETSTPFEPLYCLDIQPLNSQGRPAAKVPVFEKVPLPATGAGDQRGVYCLPKAGSLVEFGFILGNPSKPFIRSVLVEGVKLPNLGTDDVLLSKDQENYYRIDSDDNISEECQAIADRIAKTKQRLTVKNGGKMWLGNESDNALGLLSDLMAVVISMGDALASHKHGSSTTANNSGTYSSASSNAGALKAKLDAFKE
ncbi:MAG: hypothetical protein ACRBBW_17175 [Cellvibrionaceae bacterium]